MQIRLVCADARKDKMAPKREQHRPVAVLEACKHMRRAGRRMAELALPRAGFFCFVLFFGRYHYVQNKDWTPTGYAASD